MFLQRAASISDLRIGDWAAKEANNALSSDSCRRLGIARISHRILAHRRTRRTVYSSAAKVS